ncbi:MULTISPECIES: YdaU family protein [unclassified Acinetobacter]|uniref:YdaU family protein n=1 Tax=unclassified Acinetobacter TaxID=196816 RepID=UPI00244B2AE7|nr:MULTISPECIES: YdaU family protein [unclassified Acinetobacter]MDH0032546.1 YdaU family protein [Acinetobacter sp. GD04021]MDH0885237.1 YdaU family protein [Acinetobacter sp. GD03873]MDH1084435.1 YdaU family protein [Acinetobacter sp. GD03983]MDH2188323.1 YdaU family protein [Acinetobacter sp. GD03645]MDH2203834.1 YdaU family protein [Acinetobacter sp. GD03647]
MHKYIHHIGDFMRDTSHLSPIEECFYRRAIDWYYLNEKPFPNDIGEVCRLLRAKGKVQVKAVETIFKDFFYEENNFLKNSRCEKEITKYKDKSSTNRENGKLGGRPNKNNGLENHDGSDSDNDGFPDETEEKGNHKPITDNPKPITDNQIIDGSGNNAHEEKTELPPIQFATYHVQDHRKYSLLEFVNQYSQFQSDFVDLAFQRYPDVLSVDFQALMQGYCDHFAAKNGKNTPSIWFVKWLSWIQNNLQDVINRREKQQVLEHQSKQPAGSAQPQKSYFERIAEEANESSIRDVTPVKKPMVVEEYGHA